MDSKKKNDLYTYAGVFVAAAVTAALITAAVYRPLKS